jgi:hypothetical protein
MGKSGDLRRSPSDGAEGEWRVHRFQSKTQGLDSRCTQ